MQRSISNDPEKIKPLMDKALSQKVTERRAATSKGFLGSLAAVVCGYRVPIQVRIDKRVLSKSLSGAIHSQAAAEILRTSSEVR